MPSFVITGGPGSGKSTLLNALAAMGFETVLEVSRELIRREVAAESTCLPWIDLPCFASRCREKMQTDFNSAALDKVTFFDRGLPDIIAYLKVGGHAIDTDLTKSCALNQYNKTVFIAPPWEEIYINDDERWQTFEEACALYEAIQQAYTEQGYQLIELPKLPVSDRVEFIIKSLAE